MTELEPIKEDDDEYNKSARLLSSNSRVKLFSF